MGLQGSERILVVGGGIGGLTAALCFARYGFPVEVFEQAPRFTEVGAGIQLSPNCTRVLHELELTPALEAFAFLPQGIEIRDWKSGATISTTPLGRSATERYGAPYYHMHRADLIQVLADAAGGHPLIQLHNNTRVEGLVHDPDQVTLAVGHRTFRGSLAIGADGIHSIVRGALFGTDAPQFTGNVAWRALIPADQVPRDLIAPVSGAWWGPRRHFVHYFVRGGNQVNCVCVVEKSGWENESWTERGDHGELKAAFRGWHNNIQQLIDHMDPDNLYRWGLFDRAPLPEWSRGRVTLLGDSCHPTLPFMAQGAAMAIEDAAVLARCAAVAVEGGTSLTGALQQYESLRRGRTSRIQAGSRRNAIIFHLTGPAAWLRNQAAARASNYTLDWLYRYNPLATETGTDA